MVSICWTTDSVSHPRRILGGLIRSICRQFGMKSGRIDLAITDDAGIRRINRRFLGTSAVTDVISFDLSDTTENGRCISLAVNADLAVRQSRRRRHSPREELALYITHGLLHQFGFDDRQPEDASVMHAMENRILHQRGFGRIYGDPDIRSGSRTSRRQDRRSRSSRP